MNKGWLRSFAQVCIARPINAGGVTRFQFTTVRLLIGIVAALAFAAGPALFSAGAALFLITILLERSYGEIGQATGQAAPASDRYALISDSLCNALAFAGLGVGLRNSEHGSTAMAMGLSAGIAVAAVPWLVRRLEIIDGRRSVEFGRVAGMDADDVLLLVPAALWAGWAQGLLMVTAFAAPAFASAYYLTHYRKFGSG